jgi:hypothetical protein
MSERDNFGKFVVGNRVNPNGRPKDPEDIRESRKLTKAKLLKILNKYLLTTWDELDRIMHGPEEEDVETAHKLPAIDVIVIRMIYLAAKEGDPKRLEFLIQRLVGPVVAEPPKKGDALSEHIVEKPPEQLRQEIDALIRQRQIAEGEYIEP